MPGIAAPFPVGDLPPAVRACLDAWAGCIAGALDERLCLEKIRAAGFADVQVISREYVRISSAEGWEEHRGLLLEAGVPPQDLDYKVASIRVTAGKPRR